MTPHQAAKIVAPLGSLERELQRTESAQDISDRANDLLKCYLADIQIGDICEMLQALAEDDEACKKIQFSILTDQMEVGMIVREFMILRLHRTAMRDAELEAE